MAIDAVLVDPSRSVATSSSSAWLWLFEKADDATTVVDAHDAREVAAARLAVWRQSSHRLSDLVCGDHRAKVHPVELIARQNQKVVGLRFEQVAEVFADGVAVPWYQS